MAKNQGRTVRLNKPSRITKGQAGYGRKKFKVFVKYYRPTPDCKYIVYCTYFITMTQLTTRFNFILHLDKTQLQKMNLVLFQVVQVL